MARDTEAMINARIAQIDHSDLAAAQRDHAPPRVPEARGHRGAACSYLLNNSETSTQLKIKVLNVSKKDLLRDLQRAPEFDQSALFKKVYEEEFGVFGGTPFGALIGDYEFGKSGQDIELLEKISQVAAAAHAPFLTAASLRDVQPGELHAARRAARHGARSSTRPSTRSGRAFRADGGFALRRRSRCRAF